jgi:hypothetical protein
MRLEVDDTFFTICARDHLANRSVMETFGSLVRQVNLKVVSPTNASTVSHNFSLACHCQSSHSSISAPSAIRVGCVVTQSGCSYLRSILSFSYSPSKYLPTFACFPPYLRLSWYAVARRPSATRHFPPLRAEQKILLLFNNSAVESDTRDASEWYTERYHKPRREYLVCYLHQFPTMACNRFQALVRSHTRDSKGTLRSIIYRSIIGVG